MTEFKMNPDKKVKNDGLALPYNGPPKGRSAGSKATLPNDAAVKIRKDKPVKN